MYLKETFKLTKLLDTQMKGQSNKYTQSFIKFTKEA